MSTPRTTLGADPEFFIRDTRTGQVVPVCGLLGGTKGKALPIPGLGSGFGMQEDNVMAEFNIPPCLDEYSFGESIHAALRGIDRHLAGTYGGQYERDVRASRFFSTAQLEHPQAKVFGCSPDFNAYTGGMAFEGLDPSLLEEPGGAWRFAGGHVHVGYIDVVPYSIPPFVVAHFLDLFLGANMVQYEREQGKRKELYGLPGRFRPTPYGVEYRSLSNLWVHDIHLCQTVAAHAVNAVAFLSESPQDAVGELYGQVPWPSLRDALIEGNADQVAAIHRFINNTFPRHPIKRYI